MYHWEDNVFFGRMSNGSVRVLVYSTDKMIPDFPPADGADPYGSMIDLIIPENHWASIVASVSAMGENGERFNEALAFHRNPKEGA